MRGRPARLGLGILCVLALVGLTCAKDAPSVPRLIVVIVVDQMRYDYLTRFQDLYQGGFRTLLDKGAVFTEARYRHALTLTAPGHAAIMTGRHPATSGITSNQWFDPDLNAIRTAVADPDYRAVGGPGSGASPRSLLVDTFGDRLKQKNPAGRVVAVSIKDRSAILMAGRDADAAYWYSAACRCFVTSSYFMEQPPDWLTAFNHLNLPDRFQGKLWERLLDDPAVYEKYSRADRFEHEFDGRRVVFPHVLNGAEAPSDMSPNARRSPFGDQLLLEAALAAMEGHELGSDDAPDLLAVGFSAPDYVGHVFGPFSQEAMDLYLRLDRALGRLFTELDERVGPDRTLIVLTSDHGAAPVVEEAKKQGLPAKTIPASALPDAVTAAFSKRAPFIGDALAFFDAPHFFLDFPKLEGRGVARREAEEIAREALLITDSVAAVYTHRDMLGGAQGDDPFRQLYRNSFFEPRSPHLMVRLREHHYIKASQGATGHGTPHNYDRHIPIIFFGRQIPPGRYAQACGPEDIAPTLATLLGVPLPPMVDARLLTEILP